MASRPSGELEGLTGLRGIAALTVFIAHARYYEMVPALRLPFIFFEWHGLAVDLFFMLSGFVLIHVYWAKFEAGRKPFWKPYFAARFARVVPLYLATLLACLAIFLIGSLILGKWPSHVTWPVVVTNLLLLQGWPWLFQMSLNTPSWSLSVEVFCYILMMPLALLLHRRVTNYWIVAVLILLLVVWRASMSGSDSGWIGLFRGIIGFLVGALLYRFHPAKSGRAVATMTVAAAALFLVLQSLVTWANYPRYLPFFTFPFLIHGLANSASTIVHRFMKTRVMLWLGDISYSTYLWHGAIFIGTHNVIRPRLMAAPLAVHILWILFEFAVVLWISHLSYYRFEAPVRRWLRS